jgi:hypothetical protein
VLSLCPDSNAHGTHDGSNRTFSSNVGPILEALCERSYLRLRRHFVRGREPSVRDTALQLRCLFLYCTEARSEWQRLLSHQLQEIRTHISGPAPPELFTGYNGRRMSNAETNREYSLVPSVEIGSISLNTRDSERVSQGFLTGSAPSPTKAPGT